MSHEAGGGTRKRRVLHVVERLDDQAVETWLLRMCRAAAADYPTWEWWFYCALPGIGRNEPRARELGAHVLRSAHPLGETRAFCRGLRATAASRFFDAIHCHHDVVSGLYLAALLGVPAGRRIVHVHNTAMAVPTPSRMKASVLRPLLRRSCLSLADRIVGISSDALASMVPPASQRAGRDGIVHYGVDLGPFRQDVPDRGPFLQEFRLPPRALVLLFVGRLDPYKNPLHVLDVLEALRRQGTDAAVLFAGTGEMQGRVEVEARDRGLAESVRVLGWRSDVARLMLGCDVLLWPSLEEPKEGLGLGVVEAQAAGLRVLASMSVPDDAVVVDDLVVRLPLADGPQAWAQAASRLTTRRAPAREEACRRVAESPFSLEAGLSSLMRLYA